MALIHWLRLTMTQGVGPILTRRLIEHAGSAEAACDANPHLLQQIDGIGAAKGKHIAASLKGATDAAQAELDKAAAKGVRIICPDDDEYPLLLKQIHDPPNLLYVKGALEPRDLNSIAIVGSRKCSIYGREQAERFGGLLGGVGFTVISGGARGIDSAAHRGAMQHPAGRTIAVLGCGVDVVYPPENKALLEQIAERGAVISEFAMGTQPLADNFPRRNRIVSGMSRGVLVIEAADVKSGALITARLAAEHGRDMFALPGRVDNPLSIGPHQLIRDGAVFTASLEDILNGLGPLPFEADQPLPTQAAPATLFNPPTPVASVQINLSERQQKIFDVVGQDAVSADHIIERTGLAAHEVMQELTILSLKGIVKRTDGQQFSPKDQRMKQLYFVTCFIIRQGEDGWEFLQLKRSPERFMGDTWQLCTGGIDAGETATAAMLREMVEETGLTPAEFYQLDVISTFFLNKIDSICTSPMFCAIVPPTAQVTLNPESTDYRWVSEMDIVSLVMWPGERTAIAELKREILRDGPAKPYLKIDVLK